MSSIGMMFVPMFVETKCLIQKVYAKGPAQKHGNLKSLFYSLLESTVE
jgi:hypothetical protein